MSMFDVLAVEVEVVLYTPQLHKSKQMWTLYTSALGEFCAKRRCIQQEQRELDSDSILSYSATLRRLKITLSLGEQSGMSQQQVSGSFVCIGARHANKSYHAGSSGRAPGVPVSLVPPEISLRWTSHPSSPK